MGGLTEYHSIPFPNTDHFNSSSKNPLSKIYQSNSECPYSDILVFGYDQASFLNQ